MAEYIKRETAVRAVMAAKWVDGSDGAMAMEIVASPAAADVVQVVHARWIYEKETLATSSGYCCSACRRPRWISPDVPEAFKYCPKCGAKMDGERKDGGDG